LVAVVDLRVLVLTGLALKATKVRAEKLSSLAVLLEALARGQTTMVGLAALVQGQTVLMESLGRHFLPLITAGRVALVELALLIL
jgi:hypothetical protein